MKNKSQNRQVKAYSDIFIKYLFGTGEDNQILLSFVNAVLKETGYPTVVKVKVLNPFNIKEFENDKESILDLKAQDETGKFYDIEVQVEVTGTYVNRTLSVVLPVFA